MDPILAISPLDGRYSEKTKVFSQYFSEKALFKYRLLVEIKYLLAINKLTTSQKNTVANLINNFSDRDAKKIKQYEEKTNHDVKALEYFIKDHIKTEFVHFALTSEDTNNLAYALLIKESLNQVIFPKIQELLNNIKDISKNYISLPMLARTHGQPAVPTTLGKEFAVFYKRLLEEFNVLKSLKITGKLNGAVGNYNAHVAAYPNIDWIKFSKKFISSLSIEPNIITTQVESSDSIVRIFDSLKRVNNILIGFCQDIWYYISIDYLKQVPIKEETGSSTMPQKVNPIDFENAEGNLGLANSLFEFFSRKLSISRLDRDLSDSTVKRNIGSSFAFSYLAFDSILKGLSKIYPNEDKINLDLNDNWAVVSEGIQTILRANNYQKPYEALKELTRGKKTTKKNLEEFIDSLEIDKKTKIKLKSLTPFNYLGYAQKLTKEAICL